MSDSRSRGGKRASLVLSGITICALAFAFIIPVVTASADDGQMRAEALTADGNTFSVTVNYDDAAGIPAGAALSAAEVQPGTDAYQRYLDQAAAAMGEDSENIAFARFFDVEILDAEGNKFEPEAAVSVKIELADAPAAAEGELAVVHFEEDGPVVMDSETLDDAQVCFETGSFSTYGVLTTQLPQGTNDLDGWSATLDHDGRFLTSSVNYGTDPFTLRKTTDGNQAAVWLFEKSGEGYGYTYYNISTVVNGQKRYLHLGPKFWTGSPAGAHLTLETESTSGCPQDFAIEQNDDGTFSIFKAFPEYNYRRWFVNEYGGYWGSGFAGYENNDNGSHLHINIQHNQPLTEQGEEYAVIIRSDDTGEYFAVQEDGSLVPAEYDEDTGVARVKLERPFVWSYTSVHDGLDDDARYTGQDEEPTWEPFNIRSESGARGYNQGTQLASDPYYQYLTSESASGLAQEDEDNPNHGDAKWTNGIRYEDHTVHGIRWNGSGFDNTGNYLGADFENMTVTGMVPQDQAATVFFAKIVDVPDVGSNNETVSHIDIGIVGKGTIEVPLAYGTYYDENGDKVFTVQPGENRTLTVTQDFPVSKDDLMKATLTAVDNEGNEIPNAYYISGYSANDTTGHSDVQVRMEGSFKVTTLDPYVPYPEGGPDSRYRSNDDPSRRADRLKSENQVFYQIETSKEVTFDLVDENGTQLYDMNGHKLTVTAPMDISAKFNYWDNGEEDGNQCPVVQDDFETEYSSLFSEDPAAIAGRNNRNWQGGAIIDDDHTSYFQFGDYPPYIGDSGMDFVLAIEGDVDPQIVAIEVTKSLVADSMDGELISPAEPVTNTFSLNFNAEGDQEGVADHYAVPPAAADDLASKQEGYSSYESFPTIEMEVGEEGTVNFYTYDVEPGMYYIEEDSPAELIIDTQGRHWLYKGTSIETEYVWRQQGDEGLRHLAEDSLSAVPEVLGAYTSGDEEYYTGFLEFYVYNIYEAQKVPVIIKKVAEEGGTALGGAEFDVYGPYVEQPDDPKQSDMLIDHITTDKNGIAQVGELTTPGMYYLYETKAPKGYVLSEDPIIVTVTFDSDDAEEGGAAVTAEGANVVGDVEETVIDDVTSYQITVTNPAVPPKDTIPNTGDSATAWPIAMLAAFALAALVAARVTRRASRAHGR